jgi:hypothetical protein
MVYHENLKGSLKLIAFRDFLMNKISQWRFWLSKFSFFIKNINKKTWITY